MSSIFHVEVPCDKYVLIHCPQYKVVTVYNKIGELVTSSRSGNVTAKATFLQTSKHKQFCIVCIALTGRGVMHDSMHMVNQPTDSLCTPDFEDPAAACASQLSEPADDHSLEQQSCQT